LLNRLQVLTAYLQFIGERYSATGQGQVIYFYFEADDMMPTGVWKADQPTVKFSAEHTTHGKPPLTDRSSGIAPMHGIEPQTNRRT
jgi:hypothetical protein